MELTLEEHEVELLRDVLDAVLRELSYEIADTDTAKFRDALRARRARLEDIATRLAGAG